MVVSGEDIDRPGTVLESQSVNRLSDFVGRRRALVVDEAQQVSVKSA